MGYPLGWDKPSTQFARRAKFPRTPSPRSRSDRGIHPQRNLKNARLPRKRLKWPPAAFVGAAIDRTAVKRQGHIERCDQHHKVTYTWCIRDAEKCGVETPQHYFVNGFVKKQNTKWTELHVCFKAEVTASCSGLLSHHCK